MNKKTAKLVEVAEKIEILLKPLASFAQMCNDKLIDQGKGYEPEHFMYGGHDPIRLAFSLHKELTKVLEDIKKEGN